MTYELKTMDGDDWSVNVTVSDRKDLFAAIKDELMEGPTYTIRHHDYYSVVFADGEMLLTADLILEEVLR